MLKLVVLCAFVASAVAEPGNLFAAPLVQPYAAYSTVVSPGSTSISSQSSSVIHPSPVYSSPLVYTHFIKKRSADPQFLATPYNAQYSYLPYSIPAPSPIYQTPITYTGAQYPWGAHLIKKRSAPLLSTSYITPTTYLSSSAYSTPLITSPYYQGQYYTGAQLPLLNAHFIKKRSAEPSAEPEPQTFFPNTYYTPSTYINTVASSPYFANPLVNSYYSASGYPLTTTHLIKKRSAEPTPKAAPEPSAEPSADPGLLAYSAYPSTYYAGSSLYPTYYNSALYKYSPYISANPFLYSTFIKK